MKNELGGTSGRYWGREVRIGVYWRDLRERGHLKRPRVILKWIYRKWNGKVQTGLLWLGIGTRRGGL